MSHKVEPRSEPDSVMNAKPRFRRFSDGCGTAWNTFERRGVCPGCRHRWRWTSCLACAKWSRHDEWYAEDVQK